MTGRGGNGISRGASVAVVEPAQSQKLALQTIQPRDKSAQLLAGHAREQEVLSLERQGNQLRVELPARLRQAQLHLAPVGGARHASHQAALLEMRDGAADARLVHPGAASDVLCRAATLRAHGGHHAPFGNLQSEALPVDGRQVLTDFGRQTVQAERHEIPEL